VSYCEVHGTDLGGLSDSQLAEVDPRLTADVRNVLSVDGALRARATFGGTAPVRVAGQLAALLDSVAAHAAWAQA